MVAPKHRRGSEDAHETVSLPEPISPPPLLTPAADRLLAYLGNGHLGLRVGRIPLLGGLAIVNGFWGAHPKDGIPTFAPVPYPLAGDLSVDGVRASRVPDAIRFISQESDFATGELTSRFSFRTGDTLARAEVVTFCSRSDPALVLQQLQVRTDRDADLVLTASISTADVPGRWLDSGAIPRGEPPTADAWLRWEAMGETTRCGLAIAASPRRLRAGSPPSRPRSTRAACPCRTRSGRVPAGRSGSDRSSVSCPSSPTPGRSARRRSWSVAASSAAGTPCVKRTARRGRSCGAADR